ncbi:hypothetical protein PMAYCL1PPCAC_22062, partial [Pristionchus mayeri]
RPYEELYAYLMHDISKEIVVGGILITIQIPLHLAFMMVCWRLRAHITQQRAAVNSRETKAMKIREEKMKKTD